MKKIVALILALVMVMGLAAVASAATVTYDLYDANGNKKISGVEYSMTEATYNAKTATGSVEYYEIDHAACAGETFVEVAKADAEFYLTMKGQTGAVLYLAEVAYVNYTVAKEFTDIGTACAQLPGNAAKYDYFVTFDAKGVPSYWVESAAPSAALLVNGELVQVATAGSTVPHTWEVSAVNAKHAVTEVTCADCDAVAAVYETKLSAPAGAVYDANFGWLVVAAAAVEAPETDKVESAQTFDAGIAMYVGMSVMAAAGSAVVLKKKD